MPLEIRRLILKQSAAYFIKQAYHAQDALRLWMGLRVALEKHGTLL